ncbi:hypothetical protein PENSPDRAFT_688844 [Peniophora sp. CONT]|nr:hypothetical protein PENSPDRAFT_688844 [Peniophora sp. CONT]
MPPHGHSVSLDSGPGLIRAASHETDPFVVERPTPVASSASRQPRGFTRPPTRIPIPGEKLTRAQKKKLARKAKSEAKKVKTEGEGAKLPTVPEEVAPPVAKVDKVEQNNTFERCYPGHPDWAMKPLPDAEPMELDFDVSYGEFDYDAVAADPAMELWIVRAPLNLKPKLMNKMTLNVDDAASYGGHAGTVLGTKNAYDMWVTDLMRPKQDIFNDPNLKGEEMIDMEVLLPRQSEGGKLYMAPRGVQRTLTIISEPRFLNEPKPEPDETHVWKNEPRQQYPLEMLNYRFMPVGSESAVPPAFKPAQPQPSSTAPVASGSGSQTPQVKSEKKSAMKVDTSASAKPSKKTVRKKQRTVKFQGDAPEEGQEPPTKKRKTTR